MVVITLSNCPPRLRGDLTKWLIEIDACVFVGNLSARVRDALWNRICENIKNGRATMAYGTNNEQKLDFRIHNTNWEPVDYDGIKLVRKRRETKDENKYISKAEVNHMIRMRDRHHMSSSADRYVVIDIETTGLRETDSIIELAALQVKEGEVKRSLSVLVQTEESIPPEITGLTGITNEMLSKEGIPLKRAMELLKDFCGNDILIGHNIGFDMKFVRRACSKTGADMISNKTEDTLRIVRKKLKGVKSMKLSSVADRLDIEYENTHRALNDCYLTYRIYEKLKEK